MCYCCRNECVLGFVCLLFWFLSFVQSWSIQCSLSYSINLTFSFSLLPFRFNWSSLKLIKHTQTNLGSIVVFTDIFRHLFDQLTFLSCEIHSHKLSVSFLWPKFLHSQWWWSSWFVLCKNESRVQLQRSFQSIFSSQIFSLSLSLSSPHTALKSAACDQFLYIQKFSLTTTTTTAAVADEQKQTKSEDFFASSIRTLCYHFVAKLIERRKWKDTFDIILDDNPAFKLIIKNSQHMTKVSTAWTNIR